MDAEAGLQTPPPLNKPFSFEVPDEKERAKLGPPTDVTLKLNHVEEEAVEEEQKEDGGFPRFFVGTWAWGGNKSTFGAGSDDVDAQFAAARASIANGGTTFDTAEVYSSGESEKVIGRFLRDNPDEAKAVRIATKFLPYPYRLFQSSLRGALEASLERLGVESVWMYQLHGPAPSLRSVETWCEALADCVRDGLCATVGVSNCNSDQVRRAHATLAARGVPLVSNQIEYSLLHTFPEKSGLIQTCRELDVKILAYSPLAMGRLSGKYLDKEPDGNRKFGDASPEEIRRVVGKLREIGDRHNKTAAQVAIKWVIAKGCIPIVGAKNEAQAQQNAQAAATDWQLSDEDVRALDEVSVVGHTSWWQGSSD